jgi:hypothetical protein
MNARIRPGIPPSFVFSFALAVAFLAACESDSSSSSGGNPNPPGDSAAPIVVIQYPTDGSLTDAAEVTLGMVASDVSGVASLRIGSVQATQLGGFWSATVPLAVGNNVLQVEAVDGAGNGNANAAQLTLRRENALWVDTAKVAFDVGRNEALVLDPALGALFGVNPDNGARTLRFGDGAGTGGAFPNARDVEYIASRDSVLVTDGTLDAVLQVNLGNGVRTTLSSASVGSGPTILDPFGLAADEGRNRVLMVDELQSALMAIDLSSGERTILSSDAVGTGPSLIGPRSVALDLVRNRVLVTLALARAVVAVDLATGNRTVLSGGTATPAFVAPADILVDIFQDRALVADPGAAALIAVDLNTGTRQILSSSGATSVGTGPEWIEPAGVALHLGSVPFVVDPALDAVFEVGATSGDRRIVARVTVGSGPSLARPVAVALAPGDQHLSLDSLVVADSNALFQVSLPENLNSMIVGPTDIGDRRILSGPNQGSGAPFVDLVDVAVTGVNAGACILALDAGLPGIVKVAPVQGDRTLVSGLGVGSGTPFAGPIHIVPEFVSQGVCAPTALVLDAPLGGPSRLLRVDLASGERTILSDDTHGTGVGFLDPVALEIDVAQGLAYVLDTGQPAILAGDLVTGNRSTRLASPTVFVEPTDMLFDFGQQRFLIVDAGVPGVIAMSEFPPSITVLSGAQRGTGPSLARPESIVLVLAPQLIEETIQMIPYVVDSARGAILAIDPTSGERVLQSK